MKRILMMSGLWFVAAAALAQNSAADKAAAAADKAAAAAEKAASAAQSLADQKAAFPSDNDRFDGDKLKLRTRVIGFSEADGSGAKDLCAPADWELKVTREAGADLIVRFLDDEVKGIGCDDAAKRVKQGIAYRIAKSKLVENTDFRRTGFTFGGLIVPFKFRTGDKEIVSSATVAPYVGWRTGWFSTWGLTFTPLMSAGLALVPVADPSTGRSETRSAFSFSLGMVMGSSKNDAFQSGVLIGRDFLGRSDAELDPGSKKVWLSFYVGYALGN